VKTRYGTVVVFILLLFRRHLLGDLGNQSNARAVDVGV
jgi:hypothetical protein